MQAEGDVVPLPVAEEQAPPDFAAFFAEESGGCSRRCTSSRGTGRTRPS
jgi:hypothetical protein